MPLPLTVSCFSKIQIGVAFLVRLTRVVPDKGPLNGCVCVLIEDVAYREAFKTLIIFFHNSGNDNNCCVYNR